jgi:hypothetical protein
MERLPTWVSLLGLSIVIIAAGIDQFPSNERGGRENFCLATAIISLLFSLFFIAANLVDRLGNLVVGNKIENAISGIVVSLWIVAITFIQNPKFEAATAINDEGQEIIVYANLYFFSWLNFLAAVYLFGNVIRDNLAYNPKFSQWVLLFSASVVLTATAVALHDDICEKASEVVCGRLKYAVAVGSLGIIFSFISIFATMFGFMGRFLEIGTSVLSAIFYFFGVVVLTTADGPANSMGNMYFSVWGGCFCSFGLVLGVIFPKTNDNQDVEHELNAQHQMDSQI